MKVYAALILFLALAGIPFQELLALTPDELKLDRSARRLQMRVVSQKEYLEGALRYFIRQQGGSRKVEFKEFYKGKRFLLKKPIETYFHMDSLRFRFTPKANRLKLEARLRFKGYENRILKHAEYVGGKKIILLLEKEFGIIDPALGAGPDFKLALIKGKVGYWRLPAFLESGRVFMKGDMIYLDVKLKDKLPRIFSNKHKSSADLKIVYTLKMKRRGRNKLELRSFKRSFENFFLKLTLPVRYGKGAFAYRVKFILKGAYKQTFPINILPAYFKSYRSAADMTLLDRKKKTVLKKQVSSAGAHTQKKQARIMAAEKTGKAAGRNILKYIIKNDFLME